MLTGRTGAAWRQPIAATRAPRGDAAGALILLHGRGGDAKEILALAGLWPRRRTPACAQHASGNTQYAYRFTEPAARNEPYLSSARSVLDDLLDPLVGDGVPAERIALRGFSPGARLTFEIRLPARAAPRRRPRPEGRPDRRDRVAAATGRPIVANMPVLVG